jgi:hypothetical protein
MSVAGIPARDWALQSEPTGSILHGNTDRRSSMARHDGERPMSDAQRDEIKRLCHEADIPDKSGELYTEQTAQALIKDLREKATMATRSEASVHQYE